MIWMILISSSFQMRKLFLHDYNVSGQLFLGELNTKTINDAVTLHPIKDPAYMYRLHVHFNNERIQDLQQQGVKLQRVLRNMDRFLQANRLSLHEKRDLQDGRALFHQLTTSNSEKWEMFTGTSFYPDISLKAPVTKIRGEMKTEVNLILKKTVEFLTNEFWKNPHLGKLKNQEINYGYRRFHPLYGIQHILQLTVSGVKKQPHQTTGLKETTEHISLKTTIYTQQPFANLRYTTEPLAGMHPLVHFLVPLEGRLQTFRRFMKNFELVCLKVLRRVKLVVAYSSSVSSPYEHKVIMKEYQEKYPEAELIWLDISGAFSRGIALSLAANKFGQKALLFLCDVDLIFNSDFIDRCRLNTALGKRVYFPIMFSQFDPELTYSNKTKPDSHFTINKDAGIWRSFSYGPACIYRQDMDAVGGFDTSIKGWGLEDVDLFEKFVHHPEIEVFRAADPGLIHVYHKIKCDPNLSVLQYTQCQGSKASILASQKSLVRAMLSTQKKHD